MSSARGFLIVVGLVAIAPSPVRGAAGDTLPPPTAPGAPEAPPDAPASSPPDAAAATASSSPDAGAATASSSSDAAVMRAPPPPVARPAPKAVVLSPVLEVQPSPPAGGRPITRRPWFWLTIAAVVAAGAVGGLLLFRGSPKDPTGSLGSVDGN